MLVSKVIITLATSASLLGPNPAQHTSQTANNPGLQEKVYVIQGDNINVNQIQSILENYLNSLGKTQAPTAAQMPAVKTPVQPPQEVPKPVVKVPVQAPTAEQKPAVKTPVQVPQVVQKPVVKAPVQAPTAAQKPAAKVPVQVQPAAQKQVSKVPVQAQPVAQKPAEKAPVQAQPAAQKQVSKAPVQAQPAAQKPAEKAPVQAPTAVQKPAVKTPVQAQPTAQKAAAQQPSQAKPAQTTQATSTLSAFEQQVFDLTNQQRAKYGLPALKIDPVLSKMAHAKSLDMSQNNYFSHTSPTYGSPFDMMKKFGITYSSAGENIAMGQTTPQEVVTDWMNSPGHRQNILDPNYTYIGVGYVAQGNYWTQDFIGK